MIVSGQFARGVPSPAKRVLLLGDGIRGREDMFSDKPSPSVPGALLVIDFASSALLARIGLPFFPHGFIQHPQQPDWVYTSEKWGRGFALVDLPARKVKFSGEIPQGRRFFGHGASHGNRICFTVMNDRERRGELAWLDAEATTAGKFEKFTETEGSYPHDCARDPLNNQIMVLNSRGRAVSDEAGKVARYRERSEQSSLVWIDPVTGAIKKKVQLENRSGGYAHFLRGFGDAIFVCGSDYDQKGIARPILGTVGSDGVIKPLNFPAATDLRGEVLSMALSSDGRLAATLPASGEVHVWQAATIQHLAAVKIAEARAAVWSETHGAFLISSANAKKILRLGAAADGWRTVAVGAGGGGSHAVGFLGET